MQYEAWENEYRNPLLVTKNDAPQQDVLRFFKWLKKTKKFRLFEKQVLDLGCGTGRNSNYVANLGNNVVGIDISDTALKIAHDRASKIFDQAITFSANGWTGNENISYLKQNIGSSYPFDDKSFDMILDITSSNSLNEAERATYLAEMSRVLKDDGYIFVRALCKDGDKNAKNLIKISPGHEYDTYIMKDIHLVERVFSETDLRSLYGQYFDILSLEKKSGYAQFKGQSYKRNYWLAYLKKKPTS